MKQTLEKTALRTIVVISTLIASIALVNAPARADVYRDSMLRNWETGLCLDSNFDGRVYTLGCNSGNYQRWIIETWGGGIPRGPDDGPLPPEGVNEGPWFALRNAATGRCLDSNGRDVYTTPCQTGNAYQAWLVWDLWSDNLTIQPYTYGFAGHNPRGSLDSDRAGHVYVHEENDGGFQNWKPGF
ncbi:RICIN domain-containing protein [Nonomuraea helvata]|uniref:Ricin B lectin domain-containing protein n=1 Tax=Nonomuraea helvata TaxID=37484 RepID=A0ABV5RVC6_9ACTN